VRALEAAVRLEPDDLGYARDLGAAYAGQRRWPDAFRVLAPAVLRMDGVAQAIYLMAARETRRSAAALAVLEAGGVPGSSRHPDLLCEYGRALMAARRYEEAEHALLTCLESEARPARVHDALAEVYVAAGFGDLGLAHAAEYARLRPGSASAQLRLAVALSLRGRLAESRAARLEAVRLGLSDPVEWTSALHLMLNDTHEDGVSIARACGRAFEPTSAPRRAPVRRRRRRSARLRVGYLSSEFDVAPASYFLNPFLLAHDRSRVEVFLYDTRLKPLDRSQRGRLGEHVRDVWDLDDTALTRQIQADGIDVLVELSALFPDSRIPVLARRAAPIQATLPQCPTTTGCRAVDYLFTDRWTSPRGSTVEYAERLHYLPSGHVIYTPPVACPPTRPVPATRPGEVTFGLLQRFMKIGPDVWDAIAAVLRATPRSRLVLHNGDRELDRPDSITCRFLRYQIDARGVDSGRMEFAGPTPHAEHLDLLSGIDIALDTWPYSGTTTTCECLWMGVPVVTLSGRTHASRVSAALLQRTGLDELVACDPAAYVQIASRLAHDIDGLRRYRSTLRDRAVAAGLTDGRALAAAMEDAYEHWMGRSRAPRR
jgi:tetratricopeptide (TPR) repeat protein